MIGYLQGKLLSKSRGEVWILVNNVGYRVVVGERVYETLILDQEAQLYIHTHVREDALQLYGFTDMAGLQMFELLTQVSGVGPKTALAISGATSADKIAQAVQQADVAFFQKFKGVGKKGAQRIIVDLKGKLGSLAELDLSEASSEDQEVIEALVGFGFSASYAEQVVRGLDESLSVEDKIREGLKRLGKK